MRKITFALGLGVGYVLGTRSGRSRYDQIVTKAKEVADRPDVRTVAGKVTATVQETVAAAQSKVGDKLPGMHSGPGSADAYPTSRPESETSQQPHPLA